MSGTTWRARRPLGYAALAAVLLAPMAVLLARAPGLIGQRPVLESGAAWLVSPAQGVVTLVDGASEQVVGLLRVPGLTAADQVTAVQDGTAAYLVDATAGTVSRVDGARWEIGPAVKFADGGRDAVLSVLPGPAASYVVDGRRHLVSVVDPVSLRVRTQLSVGASLAPGQAQVDGAGRLWAVDGSGLARFDGTGKYHRPDGGGPQARLVLVGGRPWLVDLAAPRVAPLGPKADTPRWHCLDVQAGAPVEVTGSGRLGRVLALSPATGVLVESGDDENGCGTAVPVGGAGDRYGAPVESGGFVLVPDWTTGKVAVVDLTGPRVVATLPVARPSNRLELLVKDGVVFYNDLDSDVAGVIRFDGGSWTLGRTLHKYSTAKQGVPVLAAGGGTAPKTPPTRSPGGSRKPPPQPPATPSRGPPPSAPAGPEPPDPGSATPPDGGDLPSSGAPVGTAPAGTPPAGPTSSAPADARPLVRDLTWGPTETVLREQDATFTATVDNAAGATWAWQILDAGNHVLARSTSAGSVVERLPAGTPDDLRVRLVVTNRVGASAPFVRPFHTAASITPQITALTTSPGGVFAGAPKTFTGAERNAGDRGVWTWRVTDADGGTTLAGPVQQAPRAGFTHTFDPVGDYRVYLRVTYDGAFDEKFLDLKVLPLSTLTVRIAATTEGRGTVSGLRADCTTGTCSDQYPAGSDVTLTAHPAGSDTFAGWTGACAGAVATCTVTLDRSASVTATFDGAAAVLSAAQIVFHTGDTDMPGDSTLKIQVSQGDGAPDVGDSSNGPVPAHSDVTFPLFLSNGPDSRGDFHGGRWLVQLMEFGPAPRGPWTFSATITMTFDDGGTTTADVPLTTLNGGNPNSVGGPLPL
jgi:Divergent InlB B-repeat domain